jgi:ATP-dependent exoDNAse (exonuclease V) beta subunit
MIYKGANLTDLEKRDVVRYDRELEQITFLDKRYYNLDGEWVPSVTTVLQYLPKGKFFEGWLKDVGHSADIILEKASKEGTEVHNAAEDLVLGKEVTWLDESGNTKYSLQVWQMILKFHEFWTKYKPKLIKPEGRIYSKEHKYAGRYDLLVELDKELWLLDIKTSNSLQRSYDLQLAAYIKAFKESYDVDVQRAGILWLKAATRTESKKAGVYQGKGWQVKEVIDFDKNFGLFKNVYKFYQEDNEDFEPSAITIPTRAQI